MYLLTQIIFVFFSKVYHFPKDVNILEGVMNCQGVRLPNRLLIRDFFPICWAFRQEVLLMMNIPRRAIAVTLEKKVFAYVKYSQVYER